MDFRHFRHLRTLVEYGHFGHAAQALDLSQPALSRSIQSLEESLGVRLLDRDTRRFQLNVWGRIVLKYAEIILGASEQLRHELDELRLVASETLVVGACPVAGEVLAEEGLAALRAQGMGGNARIEVMDSAELVSRVLRGELDCAIGEWPLPRSREGIEVRPVCELAFVACVRPAHPLKGDAPVSPSALSGFPVALPRTLPEWQKALLRQSAGSHRLHLVEYETRQGGEVLAGGADVVLMAPRRAVQALLDGGVLRELKLGSRFILSTRCGLITARNRTLSVPAQALAQVLMGGSGSEPETATPANSATR